MSALWNTPPSPTMQELLRKFKATGSLRDAVARHASTIKTRGDKAKAAKPRKKRR